MAQDQPNSDASTSDEDKDINEPPKLNGHRPHLSRTSSDPDAQEMLISSLRFQIQDLFGQVTDLNTKLVKSYDRVSDLEDDLHVATSTLKASSMKISQLELERTQHLSALDDGLLVEKSQVTAELTRLMERATEEAAQRGQAENARRDIEKDLDDLSATLFGQANTMVAEARKAQHQSEEKLGQAERALKEAEEAVSMMQQQTQLLHEDKEVAEKKVEELQVLMGKGKWVEKPDTGSVTRPMQLLCSHLPYQEFLLFISHLRSVHQSSQQVPSMSTLLTLPFLARLHAEDSEPTVRLDLAPSLNWLSRRSVLSAIHSGQLVIEPMSTSILLQEPSFATNLTGSSGNTIFCALCGSSVFPVATEGRSASTTPRAPQPSVMSQTNSNPVSWPTTLFRKSSQSSNLLAYTPQLYPAQVFIFRLATSSSVPAPPPLPKFTVNGHGPSSSKVHLEHQTATSYLPSPPQPANIYPLCSNNWCLVRLRAACSLWSFVRTGIVEKIWEEELSKLPSPAISPASINEKPPLPPRRKGLWGVASALSWNDGDRTKKAGSRPPTPPKKSLEESKRSPSPEEGKTSLDGPFKASSQGHDRSSLDQTKPTSEGFPKTSHNRRKSRDLIKPPPTPPTQFVSVTESSPSKPTPPALPKRSGGRPTPAFSKPDLRARAASPIHRIASPPPPIRPPRRPITPANVPLPESRPHTPPVVTSPPTSPSIPPAASTPPPLPRRAAARASRLPQAEGPVSRPGTPAVPNLVTTAAITEEEEGKPLSSPIRAATEESEADQGTTATTSEPEVESAPDAVAEKGTLKTAIVPERTPSSASTSPSEEVFDDAKSNPDSSSEDVVRGESRADQASENEAASVVPQTGKIPFPEKTLPVVDMDVGGAAVVEESNASEGQEAEELTPVEVLDKETKLKVDLEKSNDDATGGDEAEEGKEVYVGDATWEERTWKEIVRLKEEMFWARTGRVKE